VLRGSVLLYFFGSPCPPSGQPGPSDEAPNRTKYCSFDEVKVPASEIRGPAQRALAGFKTSYRPPFLGGALRIQKTTGNEIAQTAALAHGTNPGLGKNARRLRPARPEVSLNSVNRGFFTRPKSTRTIFCRSESPRSGPADQRRGTVNPPATRIGHAAFATTGGLEFPLTYPGAHARRQCLPSPTLFLSTFFRQWTSEKLRPLPCNPNLLAGSRPLAFSRASRPTADGGQPQSHLPAPGSKHFPLSTSSPWQRLGTQEIAASFLRNFPPPATSRKPTADFPCPHPSGPTFHPGSGGRTAPKELVKPKQLKTLMNSKDLRASTNATYVANAPARKSSFSSLEKTEEAREAPSLLSFACPWEVAWRSCCLAPSAGWAVGRAVRGPK